MLVVATALTACGTPADDGAQVIVPGRPGEPAEVLSGAEAAERRTPVPVSPADVEFVQAMIPHHEQALEMATLAVEHAVDPQVAGLAERIAAVQGPEIDVMEAWLERQELFVDDHGHSATEHAGMATPAQLDVLAAARGAQFDRMFLELMIAHHEGALDMAGEVATSGTDITVAELAQDVAVTQTAEIGRMREILEA